MRLRQSREVRGVRAGDEGAAPSDGKIHSICGGVVSGLKRSRRRGVSFGPPEREIVREFDQGYSTPDTPDKVLVTVPFDRVTGN